MSKYFDEAIKMEINTAELYLLFSQTFPTDKLLWWTLNLEEINHASLLESEKLFYTVNAFPNELFSDDFDELVKLNDSFALKIEEFKKNLTRETAFTIALDIENSGIERNFQLLIENSTSNRAINLFKKLNRADKNHAKRIKDYMNGKAVFKTKVENKS